ncbi:unnamed protein product [Cuscuta epithymum]|uniref:Uncharacterized protein n=1 Tax=Cuscuta epithymum TaxID=186058 RepID=A0AAV0FGE0_9ASTE|nr:unnamed protein product [Cuscuta epithymum]
MMHHTLSPIYKFQLIQTNLADAKRLQALESDLISSRCAEEEAKEKLSNLAQLNFNLEDKVASQARVIDELREDLRVKTSTFKLLEEYGRKKRQEVVDAAGFYTWQTIKEHHEIISSW